MSREPIRITRPLLEVLLELSRDADPRPINVLLVATPAGDLDTLQESADTPSTRPTDTPADGTTNPADAPEGDDTIQLASLDPSTPVYSDFYFPDVGNAVRNVFGIDLGTPAGQSHGRFLSHPTGDPEMSVRDDLHAVVLVAIPPWEPGNVTAYDRRSRRRNLLVVAAGTVSEDFEASPNY